MGELSPVIEGHVKYREGKKVSLPNICHCKHQLQYILETLFDCALHLYVDFYVKFCNLLHILYFSGSLDMRGSSDYRQLQVNGKPKFCILFVLNFCNFPKGAFLI